jgi:hypothetical protein
MIPSALPSLRPSAAPSSLPSKVSVCGDLGHAEFNTNGLKQGQDGELYCAVRCILHGQYCNANKDGVDVYPIAARGSDSTNVKLYYGANISTWCVGEVKDFSFVFQNEVSNVWRVTVWQKSIRPFTHTSVVPLPSQNTFNQQLSWDTKSAIDMSYMFSATTAFDQDISTWITTNVLSFYGMFKSAIAFNQPLSSWDTKSAYDMTYMFSDAKAFNHDISSWVTSNVVTFYGMFNGAVAFNQDISTWSVGASCSFAYAFYGATSFNQNLNPWELQLVGKDCQGSSPRVNSMFLGSACPVQVATIPGDFCQLAS